MRHYPGARHPARPMTSPHSKPLTDINLRSNTFNHSDEYVSCTYLRNPGLQAANSSPALLKDAFVDTLRAPKYIAYGYPQSLTKYTNLETSLLLQSNWISLRSKWTFVNHWGAPLSNPLSTHHCTSRSQTPTPNLSHPLKTLRIGYYQQSISEQSISDQPVPHQQQQTPPRPRGPSPRMPGSFTDNSPQATRRGTRMRRAPERYGFQVHANSAMVVQVIPDEPTTYRQATSGDDADQWQAAMDDEIQSLSLKEWNMGRGRPPCRAKDSRQQMGL